MKDYSTIYLKTKIRDQIRREVFNFKNKTDPNKLFQFNNPTFWVFNEEVKFKPVIKVRKGKDMHPQILRYNDLVFYNLRKGKGKPYLFGVRHKDEKIGRMITTLPMYQGACLLIDSANKRVKLGGLRASKKWVKVKNFPRKRKQNFS